jgi:hypothetical protein
MSNLTAAEKRKLERLLGMESGYVLEFSNRTFSEFVLDSTGREIYDGKYDYSSGSKANRLRGFWNEEPNGVVAKLIGDLLDYMLEGGPLLPETQPLPAFPSLCERRGRYADAPPAALLTGRGAGQLARHMPPEQFSGARLIRPFFHRAVAGGAPEWHLST